MNRLNSTENTGGFPFKSDDLRFMLGLSEFDSSGDGGGIYQALSNLLRGYGNNFIVYGCVPNGSPGTNITEGWIMLGGELIKVDSHTPTGTKYEISDTLTDSRSFKDGSGPYSIHRIRRATCTAGSGALGYDGDTINDRIADDVKTAIGSASTTNEGLVEKATDAELNSGTADKYPDAAQVNAWTGGLKCKVLDIGDWNMDSTTTVTVSHGLSDGNIRHVSASIRQDTTGYLYPITHPLDSGGADGYAAGDVKITASGFVTLDRRTGGWFDKASFDDTSFNRGWVTIWYEA